MWNATTAGTNENTFFSGAEGGEAAETSIESGLSGSAPEDASTYQTAQSTNAYSPPDGAFKPASMSRRQKLARMGNAVGNGISNLPGLPHQVAPLAGTLISVGSDMIFGDRGIFGDRSLLRGKR